MPLHIELSEVLSHYGVGECHVVQETEQGYVNETWRVETVTGRYLLKRRHPSLGRPELVFAQHALMEHLNHRGFPAPRVVHTVDGLSFINLGGHVYELHEYIDGSLCDRTRPAHVFASARTLGQYHTLVDGFDHVTFHKACERYSPRVLNRILARMCGDVVDRRTARMEKIVGRLEAHVQQLEAHLDEVDSLPQLVIHGDYYAENIIFDRDTVAGVVDYDQAHWCTRAHEVAEAVIYFAQERAARFQQIVYSAVLDLGAMRRFLSAYADIVRLSPAEIQALPHLIRTIWLCSSLDPPLHPRLRLDTSMEPLHEVLALADWAEAHTPDMVRTAFEACLSQIGR
jgi:homoserine kinase type II